MSSFCQVVFFLLVLGNVLRLGTGEYVTAEKRCGTMEWTTWEDKTTSSTVEGGFESDEVGHTGRRYFELCRGKHDDSMIPGRKQSSDGSCSVVYEGKILELKKNVEQMFNRLMAQVDWISSSPDKPLPTNAVPTGKGKNGELYYTGRCTSAYPGMKRESSSVGSINGSDKSKVLNIVIFTKKGPSIYQCLKYEVLVCDPKKQVTENYMTSGEDIARKT